MFKGLLSELGGWCPAFPNISMEVLGAEDASRLEDRFSEEEVFAAISGLKSEKASGPDGFPIVFWSFSWEFVQEEVMDFFKEFFEQKKFVRSLNDFLGDDPQKRKRRGYQRL